MRWSNLSVENEERARLPGYREDAVVRHFEAPGSIETRFYEVRAKSIINRVGLGALSYANFLRNKVYGAHRDERREISTASGTMSGALKLNYCELRNSPKHRKWRTVKG